MKTALQSDSAELLKAFDVLNLPVFVIDAGGIVVACNDSVLHAFGWQREEMVGRDAGLFLSFETPLSVPAATSVVSTNSAPTPHFGNTSRSCFAVPW